MATYNGKHFITQQIESIISQLGKDDEIIISDDGSSDGTIELVKQINDDRIKLFTHIPALPSHPKRFDFHTINHYISFNYLNAIKRAKGDFIFFSDQDDIWYINKITRSIEALKNSDMIISNFSLIDQNGKVLIERFQKKKPFFDNYIINVLNPHYTGCAMAFKKEILKYVLPFPKDISCGHDNWAGICVTKFGKIKYIDEPLFYHRIHNYNNSGLGKKSPNNIFQKINIRVSLFFNILLRRK
jgi:glycosyltransferase involved in cell wall biosynthesis